ncbi:MAG TPA: nucleotidyltransferase domain-containing protein [Methanomethylovorans sp.]|nr:nucleotidyltransferase domain-containing protein [Methanomethylovorans sp.]
MNSDEMAANQIEMCKQIIVPILTKNDVDKAGIFGSFARDEANEDSDIDILVKFKGTKSLFDLPD